MKSLNKETLNSSINTIPKKTMKKPFCFSFIFCKSGDDVNNIDNLVPEIKKIRSFEHEDPQIPRHYSSFLNKMDTFRENKDKMQENYSKNSNYPIKNDEIQESFRRTDINLQKNDENLINHGNPLKKDLFLLKNNQRVIIAKIAVKNFKLKKNYSCESSLNQAAKLNEKPESLLKPLNNQIIHQEIMKNLALRLKKTCKIVLFPNPPDSISLISVKFPKKILIS